MPDDTAKMAAKMREVADIERRWRFLPRYVTRNGQTGRRFLLSTTAQYRPDHQMRLWWQGVTAGIQMQRRAAVDTP